MKIVILILASTTLLDGGESSETCKAAEGTFGLCIPITKCPPLMATVTNEYGSEEDMKLLQKNKCSYFDEIPKVCCKNVCRTPYGLLGKCVDISQCQHMQKSNLSIEYVTHLRHSRCKGETKNSVCCGHNTDKDKGLSCETMTFTIPPHPSTGCCGVYANKDRTIPGEEAKKETHPWLALVEHEMPDQTTNVMCSGSLISARYVLSAAHCFSRITHETGVPKYVRLGEFDTKTDIKDCISSKGLYCTDATVIIGIENITVHGLFNAKSKKNDIALIKMKENAPYTDYIRPICLPEIDMSNRQSTFTLCSTDAANEGSSNETVTKKPLILRVKLPVINRNICRKLYSVPISKSHICAGGKQVNDVCKGRIGGPLMDYMRGKNRHELLLVGIAIITKEASSANELTKLYTNVFEYKNWIFNNMQP